MRPESVEVLVNYLADDLAPLAPRLRREDCSAPMATGFGLATGLAIMLQSFSPGVFFLYKKRMG